MARITICSATSLLLTALGGNGSLAPKTASNLNFETADSIMGCVDCDLCDKIHAAGNVWFPTSPAKVLSKSTLTPITSVQMRAGPD